MKIRAVRWIALLCLVILTVIGATPRAQSTGADTPTLKFDTFTLPNGLTVILSEDHRLPLVAVNLWYHVGPANEERGRTGFAHLFEHMMFQGSKHVPSDAHIKLLEAAGASDINGSTDFDRTNYFETLPANQLELALWLESDRMGYLLEKLDQASLSNQQDVVRNERRQVVENVPYGIVEEALYHTVYPKEHPYHSYVIGSHADLQSARLDDVRGFFGKFYAPNNASLAIVGDFDPVKTRALVERYFGVLKRGSTITKRDVHTPPIAAERRVVVTDAVELPKVYMAWLTPTIFEAGDADAVVAASILGGGKSSRLYKRLVYDQQIAQSVLAKQNSLTLGSLFTIEVVARPGHTAQEIEDALDAELQRLQKEGPEPAEVTRAQNGIETGIVQGLETLGGDGGVADRLNMYNHYLGTPDYLAKDLGRYRAVTSASVAAFAKRYLTRDSRVVVHGVPGQKELEPEPPSSPKPEAVTTEMQGINADEPWRAAPPPAAAAKAPALPTPTRFTLPNGITILLAEQHSLPVVASQLVVRTGSGANPADLPGLANFTAAMLDEGTTTSSALQIADAAAQLGATLGTGSTMDASVIRVHALKKNFADAVDLVADIAQHPVFPDAEIERQRKSRLGALAQEREDPATVAQRALVSAIYGPAHPYGYPESGTAAATTATTRDAMRRFWNLHFVPSNAALVVAGDVTVAELRPLVERAFGEWKNAVPTVVPVPAPQPTLARLVIVDQAGSPQTELRVGTIGAPRDTPDYFPMQVLNTTLGGMFSSRLNMNLREDKGYTYGSYSAFVFRRSAGPFLAVAGVRTDATAPSVVEMLKEIGRMGAEAIPADELSRAKDALVRSLPGDFETTTRTAANLQAVYVHDLGLDYFAKFPARVAAVDAEAAQAAARKYLQPDRLVVVAVGDRAKIEPELKKPPLQLGAPELRDADGKVLPATGS
jgi:zinc protease